MGCVLAGALVASVMQTASLEVDLGARVESRSSAFASPSAPDLLRESLSAVPRGAFLADLGSLDLSGSYAARLWTSDVGAQRSLLTSHAVDARLETRGERTWRASATGSGLLGMLDPLADPLAAPISAGLQQVPTTEPLAYQALHGTAGVELAIDERTSAATVTSFDVSRATHAEDRGVFPMQRGIGLEVSLTRLATELDSVRFVSLTREMVTDVEGPSRTSFSSATATWRRRASPLLELRLGGGATVVFADASRPGEGVKVLPLAELGLLRRGEGTDTSFEATARVTTFVDRFDGQVTSMADLSCTLRWRASERVSLALTATGGARPDGETVLAGSDLRLTWAVRQDVAVEIGTLGRFQHDQRREIPSMAEGTVFVAAVYSMLPSASTTTVGRDDT